ncbi:LuxR C-terminal-related transcriptional regulator [Amycolatopsis sp. PS_44_ISF1]|uniref:helix-turn-helix transcriptional regulator n=1 Tax=Amycolatopsis sp. PS_44_ISF1 TaxID=2974917 RepID=UPI0028DE970F|nr:LuxR C-terminal-related transcriptional regulator [Amycolatopsis sp. PS_44_ISF1]MDT8909746.1 LuxR C-terminal-related transcriptional regulator [Amycolatopsis sp. PS_44_ISF1]
MQGSCDTAGFLRQSASSWFDGRLDKGLQYAEAAAAGRRQDSPELYELAQFWYVGLLIKARKLEAGRRVLDAVEGSRGGVASERMTAVGHNVRGSLLFATGRVDGAMTEISTGLRIAEGCGDRSLRPPSYVVLALGALRRADMRACRHFVDKLADEALLGYFGQAPGAWVAAQAVEARSGVESAASLIAGIVTNPVVRRQLLVSEPAAVSWLVRACTKLGADDLARTLVEVSSAMAEEQLEFSVLRGSALHAAGLLRQDAAQLREAADLHPDRWCGASAREDLANLLAAQPDERDRTIRLLESALDVYAEVGATRDAARVVNKLREYGVRRRTARAVECEGVVPHGLTSTEFAVAELVSQGNTNSEVGRQLFISRHTVAFHLKKVFQKMNITSRVELAAAWNMTS